MKFLDLDGLNTLKSYIKNTYAKKPKIITLSEIDTCGYESAAALAQAARNSETGLVFYVSDMYSTLYVYGENPVHGCVQVLVGNCTLNNDNLTIFENGHLDGFSTTLARTYLNHPTGMYNKKAGFDNNTEAWSAWVIKETRVATNNEAAAKINAIKRLFGDLLMVGIGKAVVDPNASEENKKYKLTLNSVYMGGTQVVPGGTPSQLDYIPEASTSCNGLMSIADKIKLDGLSDDGGSTVTDPTSVAKIVRFDSVVTEDVTIAAGSTESSNCILVYLKTKNVFAIKDQDTDTYYNNGSIILNDNPGIWVSSADVTGMVPNFTEGYKSIPNAIYVDKNYKMYVGDSINSLNSGGKYCATLNVINVTSIATNEINVAETE